MKASLYGKMLVLASAFLLAPVALGQCEGATSWRDILLGGSALPGEAFVESRPDLSNPGARALALGGAFVATADDTTSVIANPAGLGAIVRPSVQAEVRGVTVFQYDHFGATGVQTPGAISSDRFSQDDNSTPYFVSGVYPLGDKVVLGGFYQNVTAADRTVNRIPANGSAVNAGPCYGTKNSRGVNINVLMPVYKLTDDTSISRMGASAAFRAAPGLSIGATVYLAQERRDQTVLVGDATGQVSPDIQNPNGRVRVSSDEPGFLFGVQYSPADNIRLGAVWASAVVFGNENEENAAFPALRSTVLPMRVGLGMNWTFNPKWSVSIDGVWVGTKQLRDEMNLDDPRLAQFQVNPGSWTQKDSFEARLGLEWSVVQTRTTSLAVRLGGWMQTASNLQFDQTDATFQSTFYYDALRVIFPKENDPNYMHVTGGLGLALQKRWQFDVGVDYELETKTTNFSGLVGYTF